MTEIAELEISVESLEKENVAAGRLLELRRKQFALLLHTVRAPMTLTCMSSLVSRRLKNVDTRIPRRAHGEGCCGLYATGSRGNLGNNTGSRETPVDLHLVPQITLACCWTW